MGNDMASNGFATVNARKESACTGIGLHLVGTEHCDVEGVCDMVHLRHELRKLMLPLLKLATARVVDPEVGHEAVDDEKSEFTADKLLRQGEE